MREHKRLVAMKVVDDVFVTRRIKIAYSRDVVVPVTADKNADCRAYLPDFLYCDAGYAVPWF